MKPIFTLFLFFTLSFRLQAETLQATQVGNWNDPTIWAISGTLCNCIPTASDNVQTNGYDITLPGGSTYAAESVLISNSTLIVSINATLNVSGGTFGFDLNSSATLNNSGTININNIPDAGGTEIGIDMGSNTLQNTATGTINIDMVDDRGIHSSSSGSITNDGQINISNVPIGINMWNSSNFINSGNISVSACTFGFSFDSGTNFTNQSTGTTNVSNTSNQGLIINGTSTLITNEGTMVFDNCSNAGGTSSIQVSAGNFDNLGLLDFLNSPTITLTIVGSGNFTNQPCGKINFDERFRVSGSSTSLVNNGYIFIDYTGTITSARNPDNFGIIEDPNGAFDLNDLDNFRIYHKQLTGNYCPNDIVPNPFMDINNQGITVVNNEFYSDVNLTTSAGTYNQADNELTLNSNSNGLTELFANVEISSGCQHIVRIYFQTTIGSVNSTYYLDSDNDTYGDINNAISICSNNPPNGYVVNDEDCDDTNPSINPAAIEDCSDGIDNNCNGSIDENNFNSWIGGSGSWDNPANWSLGRVPINCDRAILNNTSSPQKTITIATSTTNVAASVEVFNNNTLIISNSSDLNIASGYYGIYARSGGTVENYGHINISNINSNGAFFPFGTGVYNQGNFTNKSTGKITIDDTDRPGIFASSGSLIFENGSTVEISNTSEEGMLIQSPVTLNGTISINNTTGISFKISNTATIGATGTITIDNSSQQGIRQEVNSSILTNDGTINIFNSPVNEGISMDAGLFNNNGTINLSNLNQGVFFEQAVFSPILNNYGTVNIVNIASTGVEINKGSFRNRTGGTLSLDQITNFGIDLDLDGSFINEVSSLTELENIGDDGIIGQNNTNFTNSGTVRFQSSVGGKGIDGNFNFFNFGRIEGNAEILASALINQGVLAPGFSPGIQTITGDYDHTNANAEFEMEIFGTDGAGAINGHDEISISGESTLGGILTISLGGGFTPTAGDIFTLFNFNGGLNATDNDFATVNLPSNDWDYAIVGNELRVGFMAILPVELIDFQAVAKNNQTQITWATAAEINNDGFEIERSADGENWKKIGFITGNGTTENRNDYQFIDTSPLSNENFYRLKQLDLDGKFEFSEIRMVTFLDDISTVSIFPNPFENSFTVHGIDMESARVEIFELNGKLLLSQQSDSPEINIENLPAGTYFLQISNGKMVFRERIIKF